MRCAFSISKCLLGLLVIVVLSESALSTTASKELCPGKLPVGTNGHLSFLALGDWGCRAGKSGASAKQRAVADAMQKCEYDPHFILALGDNFYEHGIKSVKDHRWSDVYENVYTSGKHQRRWYGVVGNHDWRAGSSGIQSQVDYTHVAGTSGRWCMPYTYYQQSISVDASGNTTAQFVFLDTTKIIDGDKPQLEWLEDVLKKSTAQWLIVVGHHPIISASDHGNIPETLSLLPLLAKYNVDVYIAGHDHVVEYLKDDNVHFFVCGSGCKLGSMKTTPPQLFYGKAELGFCGFDITREELKGSIVGTDAKKRHEISITRRRV